MNITDPELNARLSAIIVSLPSKTDQRLVWRLVDNAKSTDELVSNLSAIANLGLKAWIQAAKEPAAGLHTASALLEIAALISST